MPIRKRFRRKYRFGRRYRKRYFGSRRNRIMRKFLRRRPMVPEIKYSTAQVELHNLAPAAIENNPVSSSEIGQGVSVGTRVGGEIRLRKVYVRLYCQDNSGATGLTAPTITSSIVRLIFWTPRINYEQAAAHMLTISNTTAIPSHEVVTVHADHMFTLSPAYIDGETGPTGVLAAGGPRPSEHLYARVFKFPRKARFVQGNNGLHPDKDILYITTITGRLPISIGWTAKTFFTDS